MQREEKGLISARIFSEPGGEIDGKRERGSLTLGAQKFAEFGRRLRRKRKGRKGGDGMGKRGRGTPLGPGRKKKRKKRIRRSLMVRPHRGEKKGMKKKKGGGNFLQGKGRGGRCGSEMV